MRTGSTLLIRPLEGMEPLGAFNQPVFKHYSQICAALTGRLGSDYANIFARPDIDLNGNQVSWIAPIPGEPRRWIDLPPEEQARLDPIKRKFHSELTAYQRELATNDGNSSNFTFSRVLGQALRVPGPEYLYFINDKPVIAFWGFKYVGLQDSIDPLLLAPTVVHLGEAFTTTAARAAPPPPPFGPSRAAQPRWRWWWLPTALTLLLLLLLLSWWWFRLPEPVSPVSPVGPVTQTATTPSDVVPDPQTPTPDQSAAPLAVPKDAVTEPDHGVNGEGRSGGGGRVWVAPGGNSAVPPSVGGNVGVPRADVGVGVGGGAGTRPPLPDPALGNPVRPSLPPTAVPPPSQAPGVHSAQNQPQQQSRQQPPGRPLAIPPEAKSGPARFMEGQWHSRTGLRDSEGRPLEQGYQFDQNGHGQVIIRGQDGRECRGGAEASVGADGRLVIREDPIIKCNDGSQIAGATTTCGRGSDGRVSCVGSNESNNSHFNVKMDQNDR